MRQFLWQRNEVKIDENVFLNTYFLGVNDNRFIATGTVISLSLGLVLVSRPIRHAKTEACKTKVHA